MRKGHTLDKAYPDYTRNERMADGIIHVIGLGFGLVALSTMISYTLSDHTVWTTATLSLYSTLMVLMLTCSAAYHMIPVMDWKPLLRRFDQAAIFLKIAGTYTPFAFLKMGGVWGYGLLGFVWVFALAGAGMMLLLRQQSTSLTLILYLALGWAGIMVFWPLMASLSAIAFTLLIFGGVLYSTGTIFYIWESLPFSNAIWHIFVLAGTICHYFAVFTAVIIDV